MRVIGRAVMAGVILCAALLPIAAAAVPPDPPPGQLRVAIAQPIAPAASPLLLSSPRLLESGLLLLVGSGLLVLGSVVRRATRIQ